MFKIFMILISWINVQEEYCLSSARILTSRYQSIGDDRMKIKCVGQALVQGDESPVNGVAQSVEDHGLAKVRRKRTTLKDENTCAWMG